MKVAIIGAGNMGGAIARGLAQGHYVKASDIIVTNPSTPKLEKLRLSFLKSILLPITGMPLMQM